MSASATAGPIFVSGIYVQCASSDTTLRVIASDAGKVGKHYAPLTRAEIKAADALASDIFGEPEGKVSEVHAAYSSEADAKGDQLKKEGVWPTNELRMRTGQCTTSESQSLGREGSTVFAFVPVSCPSGSPQWTDIRLGVQIVDGKVTSHCANLGSFASVALPPADKK